MPLRLASNAPVTPSPPPVLGGADAGIAEVVIVLTGVDPVTLFGKILTLNLP